MREDSLLRRELPLKEHHTISKPLISGETSGVVLFTLAKDTDISEEIYGDETSYILMEGKVEIGGEQLTEASFFSTERLAAYDIVALEDSYLLEISYKKEEDMKNVEHGKVIELQDAIEYVDGAIANVDLVSRPDVKVVLMAFDKETALPIHAAPGDAMVIALEGEGEVYYDGETYQLKAGEQFIFSKGKDHSVKAHEPFKMGLIVLK